MTTAPPTPADLERADHLNRLAWTLILLAFAAPYLTTWTGFNPDGLGADFARTFVSFVLLFLIAWLLARGRGVVARAKALVVAEFDVVWRSTDGASTWTDVTPSFASGSTIYDLKYDNGIFVIVGGRTGAAIAARSEDGANWTVVEPGIAQTILKVGWVPNFGSVGEAVVWKLVEPPRPALVQAPQQHQTGRVRPQNADSTNGR
jgi:hypothetical protein